MTARMRGADGGQRGRPRKEDVGDEHSDERKGPPLKGGPRRAKRGTPDFGLR